MCASDFFLAIGVGLFKESFKSFVKVPKLRLEIFGFVSPLVGTHDSVFVLQSSSIELLCDIALTVVSEATGTHSLIPQATELKDKHSTLLTKFGKCHRQFNSSKVFSTEDINILGESLFQ